MGLALKRDNVVYVYPATDSPVVPPFQKKPEPLSDKNWKLYAASNYRNPQSIGDEEFESDMKRLKYIKKAFTRYQLTGEMQERLVLNHLIVLCNVLGPAPLVRLLFLKMSGQLDIVKPFLVMLRILPPNVFLVDGKNWKTDEIPMDPGVISKLRLI